MERSEASRAGLSILALNRALQVESGRGGGGHQLGLGGKEPFSVVNKLPGGGSVVSLCSIYM